MNDFRVGQGYDLHLLAAERPLIIGGVTIESDLGLAGHSDADVLIHAIIDALFGASGLGDIGAHFPDSDPAYAGIASTELLDRTIALVEESGWSIVNVDSTIIVEKPRISPYRIQIAENLSEHLHISADRISIKAKTNEGVDATGRGKAISCFAVVLLLRDNDRDSEWV